MDFQDAHDQTDYYEMGEAIYSEDTEPTEQNSQVHGSNLASGDFIPKIAPGDEITANIRSLNKKQRMVFDVLHQWARNYVKKCFFKKKIFRLTQFIYFYLVVKA